MALYTASLRSSFSLLLLDLLTIRPVIDALSLTGVGVGDATASPTAALLLSVLQESAGRIATILFAARLGTSLEPECKAWRLAADFFNDAAMLLNCISPALPRVARVCVLSLSSILSALCGVAAGSSKASLSAHFARMQNLGELNAVSCFSFLTLEHAEQTPNTYPHGGFVC